MMGFPVGIPDFTDMMRLPDVPGTPTPTETLQDVNWSHPANASILGMAVTGIGSAIYDMAISGQIGRHGNKIDRGLIIGSAIGNSLFALFSFRLALSSDATDYSRVAGGALGALGALSAIGSGMLAFAPRKEQKAPTGVFRLIQKTFSAKGP